MKLNSLLILFIVVFAQACTSHVDPGPQAPYKKAPYQAKKRAPGHTKPYKIAGKTYHPMASAKGFSQTGKASWYGKKFHGRKTANGEIYNMYAMTAAHKTLPLGTWVRVHNLSNKRSIVVRVNDRGPFVRGRIIDLSYTAAKKLGVVGPGTAPVKVVALGRASGDPNISKKPVTYTPLNYFKGNFTVQVGAFKDRTNAERLRKKLGKLYTNAHITEYSDYRGRFYRVRVGRYTSLEPAERFSRQLILDGADSAFAVAE